MERVIQFTRANLNTMVGVALILLLLGGFLGRNIVSAHHEPANKFAAAGAVTQDVDPDTDHVILSETMKVSTPFDLALSATAECSILTYLNSAANSSGVASSAEGRVELWVEIDNEAVPVQTGDVDPATPGVQNDNGEVTFCNRKYERTITDAETLPDGIDSERDFIRTRNANAFNWFALNVGSEYDKPDVPAGAGNNIVLVELHAEYTDTEPCNETTATAQEDCSRAYVGKRTLIAEPTNASIHEQVEPGPGAGS